MIDFNEAISELEISSKIEFINEGVGYDIYPTSDGYIVKYDTISNAMRALLMIKSGLTLENRKGAPFFTELGYMIDLSRNAVLNLPTMKKLIRMLAYLGYNELYLYMEDTYEVDNEPYFGLYRGRYTKAELNEIDAYAKAYGIEAIPCIQTLAHLGGIFKWDNYNEIKDIDNILLVGDDKTYKLIRNMIKTLRECFTTNKIHIGMDEAHNLGLGKYLDKHGYTDRFSIMDMHIKRVNSICKEFSFKPMIWSDMFFRLAFHGDYYADSDVSEEILAKIPTDIELVYWDYYQNDKKIYDSMINKHKKITSDIRFAGGAWKWMGFVPNNHLSLNTSYNAIKSLIDNDIRRVMVTAWGDDGAEASVFSSFPAVAYYAECNYRGSIELADKALRDSFKALTGCNYDDLMDLDLLNEPNGSNSGVGYQNPSKYLLYNDLFTGRFDYMVKPGFNDHYRMLIDKLDSMAHENKSLDYLFITLRSLAKVLSIKSELGLNIYNHYRNNNLDLLKKDLRAVKELIAAVEQFYNSFLSQWHKENKPQGFDTHSIRLGGLVFRLKYIYDVLDKYLNKEIDKIEDLEGTRITLISEYDEGFSNNQWGLISTVNKLIGW